MKTQKFITSLLEKADIQINGSRSWDLRVHDDRLYTRVVREGNLGLGEGYMDGWFDCEALDQFFYKVLMAELDKQVAKNWRLLLQAAPALLSNLQRKSKAFEIGQQHYDIGNDLYQKMLDPRMTYTCGYWNDLEQTSGNLARAQEAKLDLACRKIGLKKGDKVLDIGCGWGSFAKFAAEKYGAQVKGVTVSKEQIALGQKMCEGLPVELCLQDYRNVQGKFDHVVSFGMFEHVGYKNYHTYMATVRRVLKPEGFLLLHTIGSNESVKNSDAWITKYIFTNSMLPSVAQIGKSIEGLFVMEDWHNFSADYDPTLMAWHANFEMSWPELKKTGKYSERFHRMWRYYLLSCAGMFRARKNQLWQVVLSPKGVPGGSTSIR